MTRNCHEVTVLNWKVRNVGFAFLRNVEENDFTFSECKWNLQIMEYMSKMNLTLHKSGMNLLLVLAVIYLVLFFLETQNLY